MRRGPAAANVTLDRAARPRSTYEYYVQRSPWVCAYELVEEREELLVGVLLVAGAGDLAGRDL